MINHKHLSDEQIYKETADNISFYRHPAEIYFEWRLKRVLNNFLSEEISKISSRPIRILDIGSYIGRDLFMIDSQGKQVERFGVDISKETVAFAKTLAKQRGEKNISFTVGDANKKLPFKKNYFDIILASSVIEHLLTPKSFLTDVRRILKVNGLFIVTTSNDNYFLMRLEQFLPNILKSKFLTYRKQDFSRAGDAKLNPEFWDTHAHISTSSYQSWIKLFKREKWRIEKIGKSSFFGGSRFLSNNPFFLGFCIQLDSIIQRCMPPSFPMCFIVTLRKRKSL